MSVWKNVSKETRKIATDGSNPEGILEAAPGKTITLKDSEDYLIAEGGVGAFEKVEIKTTEKSAEK